MEKCMTVSVMFDSNIYRKVLESNGEHFSIIHEAIKTGKIKGFLSEVIFQIEAIKKADRNKFFDGSKASSFCSEETDENGNIRINTCISRNYNDFPQGSNKVPEYLTEADSLGIKIVRNSRIGFPKSIVPENMFLKINDEKDFHRKNNKRGDVCNEIENMGCGISHIRKLSPKGTPLCKILESAVKKQDENVVAKAFAEWADGDAIASCIGYGIDYFCTEDNGKAAGTYSVCAPANKTHLESLFPIKFISVQGLLNIITTL